MRPNPDTDKLATRPPINQNVINRKLVVYGQKRNYAELNETALMPGQCNGLAGVWGFYAEHHLIEYWESVLALVSLWPEDENSLSQKIRMPAGSKEEYLTYDQLLFRVANLLVYNQLAFSTKKEMFGFDRLQFDHFRPGGSFFSEQGGIQFHQPFAGYFDPNSLCDLLRMIQNNVRSPAMILVSSATHVVAVHYDVSKQSWYFYDPNESSGKITFQCVSLLAIELTKKERFLENSLNIGIASWEENVLDDAYRQKFYAKDRIAFLLQETGLHAIVRYAPDQLPAIFSAAGTDYQIKGRLVKAIKTQDRHKLTGLETVATVRPEYLPMLIEFFQKNSLIAIELSQTCTLKSGVGFFYEGNHLGDPRCLLKESFVVALQTEDKDGRIGLNTILLVAPHLLRSIIMLPKDNHAIRESIIKMLSMQNFKSLELISECAPVFLSDTIDLIMRSDDANIKIALLIAFFNINLNVVMSKNAYTNNDRFRCNALLLIKYALCDLFNAAQLGAIAEDYLIQAKAIILQAKIPVFNVPPLALWESRPVALHGLFGHEAYFVSRRQQAEQKALALSGKP